MGNQERQHQPTPQSSRRYLLQPWQAVTPGAASERHGLWDELRHYERLLVPHAARPALMDDIGRAAAEHGCVAALFGDNVYVVEQGGDKRLLFAAALLQVKGTYDGR